MRSCERVSLDVFVPECCLTGKSKKRVYIRHIECRSQEQQLLEGAGTNISTHIGLLIPVFLMQS